MRTWTLSDAKKRFAEVFRLSAQEPQIVYDKNKKKPIGVVVGVKFFDELMNLRKRQPRPTIAELFDELREIQKLETAEIDVPKRSDRPNPMIGIADELSH
jgi:hypothetical protein